MNLAEVNAMRYQRSNRKERRARGKELGIKIEGSNKPYVKETDEPYIAGSRYERT